MDDRLWSTTGLRLTGAFGAQIIIKRTRVKVYFSAELHFSFVVPIFNYYFNFPFKNVEFSQFRMLNAK